MERRFFSRFRKPIILLTTICVLLTACNKLDVFEKNVSIPGYQWQYKFQPGFDFTIRDTAALYNIFIVLRHTDAYRKNNIWLSIGTQLPGDSAVKYQRVDLILGNDSKGWEGVGMDDIWEVRKPLTNGPARFFTKQGQYHSTIAQIMREDPLLYVMSVGVRVEKAMAK